MTDIKTEKDNKEREENLIRMKSTDKWPCWPILPLKRVISKAEMPEMGFMFATGEPVVYLKSMLDLRSGSMIKDIMRKTPSKSYLSFEEILDDGWVVD